MVYQVPGGYFEGLADLLLNRVRALDALDEELVAVSPFIHGLDKSGTYQVPAGYFNGLEKRIMETVLIANGDQSVEEELEVISPLLSGLKKEMPYSVPANYFESLTQPILLKEEKSVPAKVVSMPNRTWIRYAAAAAVIAFVSIGSFLFLTKDAVKPAQSYAWVKKSMKDVPTATLDSFITITDKVAPVIASNTPAPEVQELIKNITDEELQNFLDDVEVGESDADEDIILN